MILEFSAGADHGVKVKTKRRKNSARYDGHGDIIKIWNYRRHEE
jgi:predicted secreted protein